MQYHSTNRQVPPATFEQAVIDGLAKDKGLFMPESVPALPAAFFTDLPALSLGDIARKVARPFIEDEIPEAVLGQLVEEALNFPIPLVSLAPQLHVLELFHGPTLAFKDVGARFMSRVMAHFLRGVDKKVYVLVATSETTGSAVAQGFYNVPGIEVIILYPSGKVSRVQEAQFATLGNNVTALEIEGTFDDCQRLVKTAFADAALREELYLTSANSINFARLLPQSFYYFYAYGQLAAKITNPEVVFSVPSGNYGNLTAGLLAEKMGLPATAFLAASNANDTVPEYLTTRTFRPRPSVATLSNAMDVGDPSNFARMQRLFGDSWEDMQKRIRGYSFTDAQTAQAIREVYDTYGYLIDPHGAVGYLAATDYRKTHRDAHLVVLATAHPAKFADAVESATGQVPPVPPQLGNCLHREKLSLPLANDYLPLKNFLLLRNGVVV